MYNRVSKIEYYLNIAQSVAERSTCIRRNYGAIIVKDDIIIATGYNGAPRGCSSCVETGVCRRAELGGASETYDLCCAVHAEMNCIINAQRNQMYGATIYLVGIDKLTGVVLDEVFPCKTCQSLMLNAGIYTMITRSFKGYYDITGRPELQTRSHFVDSFKPTFERRTP